jgi:hypothetical protein
MLNKINLAFQLFNNMGPRYLAFRLFFEFKKRIGLLRREYPTTPLFTKFTSLMQWKSDTNFLTKSRLDFVKIEYPFIVDDQKNENQKKGKFEFFSSLKFNLGSEFDWITNPETGFKYDINKHWTEINDFDPIVGDIKYVWEKSRFSFLYLTIRSDIKNNTDSSEYVLSEILDWIDKNPINKGPNYKCSQEISIRIINWTYALHFYRDSKVLTEEYFDKIIHVIYCQVKHVYTNINFSRIAVRNNHAITETLLLYFVGLVYPFFPESNMWKIKGKKWFEEEIKYQIYSDGTHLQFSMNYHRVVVQLLNLSFLVSKSYNEEFSEDIYHRAYESLNFLYQLQDISNGMLPNYGANDGALFFPLTNCLFRDFRPSLNTLHNLLTGQKLYSNGPWEEEYFLIANKTVVKNYPVIQKKYGWNRFDVGGFYVLNEKDSMTFIRCGSHKDRPSQADNLHMDVWYKSENILLDAGTYKYNTVKEYLNYFFGSESHNTVMLNDYSQMIKGGRFIWYFWTNSISVATFEKNEEFIFEGKISAFRFLNKNILHSRKIVKTRNEPKWLVEDEIFNKPADQTMRQIWHPNSNSKYILNILNTTGKIEIKNGFISTSYGIIIPENYYSIKSKNDRMQSILKLNEDTITAPIFS